MSYELHPLAERARAVFTYDPDTGLLTRRVCTGSRAAIGTAVGHADRHGHMRVSLDGIEYAVHRLVWLLVTGRMPSGDIDHINGNRADNRWSNLRDVSHRVNLQNRRSATAANKCGLLGVSQRGGSFLARIKVNGKQVCLGSFGSGQEAHAAYLHAKRNLHEGCTL